MQYENHKRRKANHIKRNIMITKIDSDEFRMLRDRLDTSVCELNEFIDKIGETDISGNRKVDLSRLKILAKDVSNKALDLSKIKAKK